MTTPEHPPTTGTADRPALTVALAARPVDPRRRLPIPYVSEHGRGGESTVDFTAINADRAAECGRRRLCSLCGTAL